MANVTREEVIEFATMASAYTEEFGGDANDFVADEEIALYQTVLERDFPELFGADGKDAELIARDYLKPKLRAFVEKLLGTGVSE